MELFPFYHSHRGMSEVGEWVVGCIGRDKQGLKTTSLGKSSLSLAYPENHI